VTDDVVRFFGVPERLELDDGVVVRRYVEADIPVLVEVVNTNLEHLAGWMPWAQEPATLDAQHSWFRETEKHWAEGTDFTYGVFGPDGRLVGGTGFHVRNGPGALEIGYWLAADAVGRGLMTRVADALTKAAATVPGVTRVEIHCDAANVRSAAVPERLGYAVVRVEEREVEAPAESGRHLIWSTAV
jgi:RimJ/RimL family protein N-acetyltransferase